MKHLFWEFTISSTGKKARVKRGITYSENEVESFDTVRLVGLYADSSLQPVSDGTKDQ